VIDPKGRRGEWWVLWYDADSRRHREKAGTKSAARDLYALRKTQTRQLLHFPETMRRKQSVSLKAICADYTDSLKANGRDSREQAKTRLEEVTALMGEIPAKSITPQDIERLKARLGATPARGRKDPEDPKKERSRTPASVNRYLQDLRAAFNLARRNGKVDRNPVADVRLMRENNKRVREMTVEEEKAILTALDPSQKRTKSGRQDRRFRTDLRPLVRFLLDTGLRAGEACNLRWPDVDWRAEVVTLRETKAGKVQHASLSAEAVDILTDLLRADDGYVFAWADGRPFTVDYVTHAFHKAAVNAGVADVHVHDCRHTAACRWLRAGVDIYTVSKLLRHASVVMSERYAHLSQGDLKAAVQNATATTTATSHEAV
jgi:integrase